MSARTREPWWKMRLPKEIGPHEGIEFKLIEQGKKDLALFGFDYPEDDHYAKAKLLGLGVLEFDHGDAGLDGELKNVVFYRPGYQNKAQELVDAVKLSLTRPEDWQAVEYQIGSLLGYTDHEISVFIKHLESINE